MLSTSLWVVCITLRYKLFIVAWVTWTDPVLTSNLIQIPSPPGFSKNVHPYLFQQSSILSIFMNPCDLLSVEARCIDITSSDIYTACIDITGYTQGITGSLKSSGIWFVGLGKFWSDNGRLFIWTSLHVTVNTLTLLCFPLIAYLKLKLTVL